MRNLLITCLLSVAYLSLLLAQQNGNNPFEISNTHSDTAQSITNLQSDIDSNVFSREIIQQEVDTSNIDISLNLFEVSHVPVRKSQHIEQESVNPSISPSKTANPDDILKANSFIFYLTLISTTLLALVLSSKVKLIPNMFKSLMNENLLKLVKREENNGFNLQHILLYVVFVINISIFIYLLAIKSYDNQGVRFWLSILSGVIFVYFVRSLSLIFIGSIFPIRKQTELFNYTIILVNILIGISILPFNLLLAYGPDTLFKFCSYAGISIILLYTCLKYLRGLMIATNFIPYHLFLFFLYLCTFEMAPLMLLWSYISKIS